MKVYLHILLSLNTKDAEQQSLVLAMEGRLAVLLGSLANSRALQSDMKTTSS